MRNQLHKAVPGPPHTHCGVRADTHTHQQINKYNNDDVIKIFNEEKWGNLLSVHLGIWLETQCWDWSVLGCLAAEFLCWYFFVWGHLRGPVHFVGKLQERGGFSGLCFFHSSLCPPHPQSKPGPYASPVGVTEGRGQQGPPTSVRQVMDSRGSELTGLRGHCLHALPEQRLSVPRAPKGLLTEPYGCNKCMSCLL